MLFEIRTSIGFRFKKLFKVSRLLFRGPVCYSLLLKQRLKTFFRPPSLLDEEQQILAETAFLPVKAYKMVSLLSTSARRFLLIGISIPLINRSFSLISSILSRLMIYDR
jgi:hypothetical protein